MMRKSIAMLSSVFVSVVCAADTLTPEKYDLDWRIKISDSYTKEAARTKSVDLLFLGDSIMHGWTMTWMKHNGMNVWKGELGGYSKLNFGLSGDKVQNLLWRITEGKQLDGARASIIVLMIGTNNVIKSVPNQEIAEGIQNLLKIVREKQPDARIILLGIPPVAWKMKESAELNPLIEKLADKDKIVYVNLAPLFLDANGKTKNLHDGLHPDETGYKAIAEKLIPLFNQFLGKK